nr:choice-of-anchor X domain-containing protein [Massilia sp. JS1662]
MPSRRHDKPQRHPAAAPKPRLRRLALAAAAVAVIGVLVWSAMDHGAPAPAAAAAQAPAPRGPHFFGQVQASDLPLPDDRNNRRRQLVENVQLADHTYCSYRTASQYPVGSRPMTENPDQNRPNDPVASTNPMRLDGGGANTGVQLQTSQSRVYMASGESVAFSLRAIDADGKTLPLVITRALAQGITYAGTRQTPQVSIPFADDGTGADPVPNDGAFAGVLAPAQTGLAAFNGTIRTEVRYNVGGKTGLVQFDVIYTPELPAVWTGAPREAVEEGSLVFHLPLDVRMPGRYIVNGRVDDARGQPVALLTFNEVLGPGPNDIKLTMFGKLLRDQAPAAPLTLRDVDGYLLKENTDPDRALLPRLQGKVLTAASHAPKNYSDAEWQSEERSRYLTEFGKDLREARGRLAAFDPAAPLPPSECMPATR